MDFNLGWKWGVYYHWSWTFMLSDILLSPVKFLSTFKNQILKIKTVIIQSQT